MKKLSDYFAKTAQPKTTFKSQRAELMHTIIHTINKQREGTKYKPVTPVQIGVKLKHMSTSDMVGFVKECQQARNFSECFWYKLKKK